MIIIIDKNTNVVVDIVETAEMVENGLKVTRNSRTYIYAGVLAENFNLVEVESVPGGVAAQEYKYVNGEFVPNPDYVAPEND